MAAQRGTWAVVTGASGGIGKELAVALAEKGVNLVLAARSVATMEALAAQLRGQHGIETVVEALDLAAPGAASQLKHRLDQRGLQIDILINNAGAGIISEFTEQPLAQINAMLQLNIVGLTELTHLYAQDMQRRGRGHILLLASVAGYFPCPLYASYAATKAYVLSLGVALHTELAPHGVGVTVLSPGVTDTGFFDAAGEQPNAMQRRTMMQPRAVADIGLAALFANRASVVAGRMNRYLTVFTRLIPRRMMSAITLRAMQP